MKRLPHNDPFEKAFRDKTTSYEELPPLDGWSNISSILDRERRKRRLAYYFAAAGLLLLCSTITITFFYQNQGATPNTTTISINDDKPAINESSPATQAYGDSGTTHTVPIEPQNSSYENNKLAPKEYTSRAGGKPIQNGNGLKRSKSLKKPSGYLQQKQLLNSQKNIDSNEASAYQTASSQLIGMGPSFSNKKNTDKIIDQESAPTAVITIGTSPNPVVGPTKQAEWDNQRNTSLKQDSKNNLSGKSVSTFPPKIKIPQNEINVHLVAIKVPEQEEAKDKKKETIKNEKKTMGLWSIKMAIGSSYLFKKITPMKDNYFLNDLTNKNRASIHNGGYRLNAEIRRNVNNRFTIMGGIDYQHLQEFTQYSFYKIVPESYEIRVINDQNIEVNPVVKTEQNTFENEYNYLGAKLGLSYALKGQARAQRLQVSYHFSKLMKQTVRGADPEQQLKPQKYLGIINFAWENAFPIGNEWEFTISPNASYALSSVYGSQSVYTMKPLIIGLNLGIIKNIK